MKRVISKVGVVIIMIMIAIIIAVLIACGILTPEKQSGFWGQLGITRESIKEVQLEFQGQRVGMTETKAASFLDTLTTLETVEVADDHEFTPSDIKVILKTEGEEQEVIFYWFTNHQTVPAGVTICYGASTDIEPMELLGNRVDVLFDGNKYHFQFTTQQVWSETLMRQSYDQLAESQGLFTRCELLGGDRFNERPSEFQTEVPYLEDIVNNSELIFLGTYMVKVNNNYYYKYGNGRSLEVFAVDEVLKGSFDGEYYRMSSEHTTSEALVGYEDGYWDQISIAQQSIHNPDYLPGVQYLICVDIIQYEVEVDTDQDSYTYMEQRNQTHGQYDTAVVDGDMLYPRYNTELHPFYNLHLNELKELLQ